VVRFQWLSIAGSGIAARESSRNKQILRPFLLSGVLPIAEVPTIESVFVPLDEMAD